MIASKEIEEGGGKYAKSHGTIIRVACAICVVFMLPFWDTCVALELMLRGDEGNGQNNPMAHYHSTP